MSGAPLLSKSEFTQDITLYAKWSAIISVASNISGASGVLTGAGTYDLGTSVTLSAYANKGYDFVHWLKDGSTFDNNSTNQITITADCGATYTAVFEEAGVKIDNFGLSIEPSNKVCGMVWGETVTKDGVLYARVRAMPSAGYAFSHWKIGGVVSTVYTDWAVSIPLSEVQNDIITAVFVQNSNSSSSLQSSNATNVSNDVLLVTTYNISVTANNSDAVGVLNGDGSYEFGTSVTLSAYAKKGYQFVYWLKDDEIFANNDTNKITVTISNNCTYKAIFMPSGLKIDGVAVNTVCVDDSSLGECGEIALCGLIRDDVNYLVVSATAKVGYKFIGWSVDGVPSTIYTGDSEIFAYTDIANKLITARFEVIDKTKINTDTNN